MKNYLLFAVLLFPFVGQAQSSVETPWLNKGQVNVGVGIGPGFGGGMGFSMKTIPYVQYFIKDKWAVGLEGHYDQYSKYGSRFVGAGVSTQYHFLRTDRLSLYGKAGYSYGQLKHIPVDPYTGIRRYETFYDSQGSVNLGAGIQYRVSSRWFINSQIEKRMTRYGSGGIGGSGGYNATLGVGFRIR